MCGLLCDEIKSQNLSHLGLKKPKKRARERKEKSFGRKGKKSLI